MRQSTEAFGIISHFFYVKVDLGSRGRCQVLFTPGNLCIFPWARVSGIHVVQRWQLPTKFIGELTVYTASVPVSGYPGVCNHEVPPGAQLQGF